MLSNFCIFYFISYCQENTNLNFGDKNQKNMSYGWTTLQHRKQKNHPHRCLLFRDGDPVEVVFDQPIDEISLGISSPVNERGG